jgi:hypothetical protein
MTHHFTKSTVSAEFYCGKCGRMTQHAIAGGRKGSCLECRARLEREHLERAAKGPQAKQLPLL